MAKFALYFAPGACSRVPIICMHEMGLAFEPRLVRFMALEHRSAAYLAKNPKGKVPTLVIDGEPLTENVAILTWLARRFPEKRLLPFGGGDLEDARILADLAWCASGLHPIVTRIRMPQFFSDTEEGRKETYKLATAAMEREFAILEERLESRQWLLGAWSALDAYVYWVFFRVTGAGFDATGYPRFSAHAARMEERDSVKRLVELEKEALFRAQRLPRRPGDRRSDWGAETGAIMVRALLGVGLALIPEPPCAV